MGDSGGGGETSIRYAPYVERYHESFVSRVYEERNMAIYGTPTVGTTVISPFSDYVPVEVEDAFFGAGYLVSSFPSLYDMYGKFMAGLDIEVLWTQLFEDTVNSPAVDALITAETALMDDDIEANSMPRLQIGMRDINAIMASSYVVGRAIIEDARVKARAKYAAELRYRLITVAQDRWQAHLQWNQNVVGIYAELMKFYYSAKTDVDDINYAMAAKDALWPFTVLDFERAALGALQGAMNTKTDVAGASTAKRTISGALSGAAMGAMAYKSNPGYGAAIGAVVGGIAGALN